MGLWLVLLWRVCGAPSPASAQQGNAAEMQKISVRPGDTLWSVAKKYLKDPSKWDELLRYNTLPTSDLTVALPGMTLSLPVGSVREEFQAARIVSKVNRVLYRDKDGGPWLNAALNMEVFRNDTITTLKDSKAVIRFLDKSHMQIDADSMAIVMPTSKDYHIELKRGGVAATNKRIRIGAATVSPASPNAVYTASVRDDQTVVVQVYKGMAAVRSAGKTVHVGAGKATEARPGLAPSLPFNIPDLGALKSFVSGFEEQLQSVKRKLVKAASPAAPMNAPAATVSAPAPIPIRIPDSTPTQDLEKEAAALMILEPVMGYRIECSNTQDFSSPLARQYFDADVPMRPESFDLPPDRYWCRIAVVDLLGSTGKFKEPKVYALGRAR